MDVKIENAKLGDISRIMELEEGSIIHPWDRTSLENLITDDNKIALISLDMMGNITGYIGCSFVLDESEIGNLVVDKNARRQGIGNKILTELFDRLKSRGITVVFLEVESTNLPAVKLYEKAGFKPYNKRADYYGPGKDCILMRFDL